MMVNGLPAHVLLVHAVVVLVPLCAVLAVLVAVWPAARRRLSLLTAVLAVLALAMVPITTEAGDWLEHRMPRTPLLHEHTQLGDTMLPWAAGLALVAVLLFARQLLSTRRATARLGTRAEAEPTARLSGTARHGGTVLLGGAAATVVLAVLTVVVAAGSVVTVYRIGDSGARAAWTGQFSQQELPRQARIATAPSSPR